MNKKIYEIIWFFRKVKRKLTKKPVEIRRYAGKAVRSREEAGELLSSWIAEGIPFMAARFGGSELNAMVHYERPGRPDTEEKRKALEHLIHFSGFFPDKIEYLERFSKCMQKSSKGLDMLGVWGNYMEDYMVERYCPDCITVPLEGLEPWYVEKPWTAALKGKKVLVIHPFEATIREQYQRREKLFPGTDILPEFGKLYTVKAVQTLAGNKDPRFEDWFEALEWTFTEAMRTDFDLAMIGCGAYGLPLASMLKEAGKQAVHLGGATQLLFGIKGGRWDNHPVIGKLYNEYWVRPGEEERPRGAETIEEGCYW